MKENNFLEWYRNFRIILKSEQKLIHLEEALLEAPPATDSAIVRNAYTRTIIEHKEVACLMKCLKQSKHSMLSNRRMITEKEMPKKAPDVLAIRQRKIKKNKEDVGCHHYGVARAWKRNCPSYLAELNSASGVYFVSMIGISLNCNGLGSLAKRDWVKDLGGKIRPSFFGIQETKFKSINQASIRHREDIRNNLLDWDVKAKEGRIRQHDITKREEWLMDLLHINRLHNKDLEQKCRIRWTVDSLSDIKQASLDHFSSRFKEMIVNLRLLKSNLFCKLSDVDASFLEYEFSLEEVRAAVWDCAGSKAPGLDGFNFNFIKAFWDVVKIKFWNCIHHFKTTGVLKKRV
ncbi:hypothetical protein Tco_1272597 [Tanacetum coccineum]